VHTLWRKIKAHYLSARQFLCGVINWKPMKLFLLLAAIYSLIFYHSNKIAKEKEMAAKKNLTKEISLQTNSPNKQIVSPNFIYGNSGYLSNSNVYFKWNNNE
jgi:hypothetical protein